MAEKKFNAKLFLFHYACDNCGDILVFAGETMGNNFKHVCKNKACNSVKFLPLQYPYTSIDIVDEVKAEAVVKNLNENEEKEKTN